MKRGTLPFILLLVVGFSGCIPSAQHVKKGDKITAKIADQTEGLLVFLEGKYPGELGREIQEAKQTAHQAKTHAKNDPTPPLFKIAGQMAGSVLSHPGAGPIGALGTLALGFMGYQRKKKAFSSLVDDLVKTQDKSKCEALRKGII